MRRVIIIVGLLVFLTLSWTSGWVIGLSTGGYRERHQRFLDEQGLLAPILASDSAFENVRVIEETGPGGGIQVFGTVKSAAALERLRAELMRVFGEPRARALLEWASLTVR